MFGVLQIIAICQCENIFQNVSAEQKDHDQVSHFMETAHYHLLLVLGVSSIQGICQFEIRHRIAIVFVFAHARVYVTALLFVYATADHKRKRRKTQIGIRRSLSLFSNL